LGFSIQYHKLELYGLCHDCAAVGGRPGRLQAVGSR
jgi:hypothetical protein